MLAGADKGGLRSSFPIGSYTSLLLMTSKFLYADDTTIFDGADIKWGGFSKVCPLMLRSNYKFE